MVTEMPMNATPIGTRRAPRSRSVTRAGRAVAAAPSPTARAKLIRLGAPVLVSGRNRLAAGGGSWGIVSTDSASMSSCTRCRTLSPPALVISPSSPYVPATRLATPGVPRFMANDAVPSTSTLATTESRTRGWVMRNRSVTRPGSPTAMVTGNVS